MAASEPRIESAIEPIIEPKFEPKIVPQVEPTVAAKPETPVQRTTDAFASPRKNEAPVVKSQPASKPAEPVNAPLPRVISTRAPVTVAKKMARESNSGFDWVRATALRIQSEGQLSLGLRQAGSLRSDTRVSRCEVENGTVCEALHFEPTEISIVGKSPGETRIAVWLDEEPNPLLWNVKVEEQKRPSAVSTDNQALTKLLADMYPQSRIRLSSAEGELIVEGKAKNRKEAVQILSFIRSVRLIPVVDRLTLQDR